MVILVFTRIFISPEIKIIRAVTVAQSVDFFVGMIPELEAQGYEVVSVSSDGPQLQMVRDAGARTIVVDMERHISPLKDLKSLCQMIKVFRREHPDMVHSMTPKAGLLCMMAAWLCRVPVRIHTYIHRAGVPDIYGIETPHTYGYRLADLCLCHPYYSGR